MLSDIGGARIVAALVSLATLPCAFLRDIEGGQVWTILVTAVAPGVAFFLIWAIPFDALMARVFMTDQPAAVRQRYRNVIKADTAVWLALLLVWGWFFYGLLTAR